MKTIKRWTSGIFSRVDWAVSQIENQEALINSALKESRESVAKAKVQMRRVTQDGETLRRRLQNEKQNVTRWRERAAKVAKTDEASAIDCLRRSKQAERLCEQLHDRIRNHEQVESQLAKDVGILEERLSGLMEKRNLMRTRQSRAEALTNLQDGCVGVSDEVDEIFDRWDICITEKELAGECVLSSDPLEESFSNAETEAELHAELQELLGKQDY